VSVISGGVEEIARFRGRICVSVGTAKVPCLPRWYAVLMGTTSIATCTIWRTDGVPPSSPAVGFTGLHGSHRSRPGTTERGSFTADPPVWLTGRLSHRPSGWVLLHDRGSISFDRLTPSRFLVVVFLFFFFLLVSCFFSRTLFPWLRFFSPLLIKSIHYRHRTPRLYHFFSSPDYCFR